jgi:hypothetical protein
VAKKIDDAQLSDGTPWNDRRKSDDRRKVSVAVDVERRVGPRREKVSRRRQIDPTTCERDYSDAEVEFMSALDVNTSARTVECSRPAVRSWK